MSHNSAAVILFFTVLLAMMFAGFMYFFSPSESAFKKAVKCTNEWYTISFLINDVERSVLMGGEPVDPQSITIFNETAIAANWGHKQEKNKIFMDRIAGNLEVETKVEGQDWKKNEFECSIASLRF